MEIKNKLKLNSRVTIYNYILKYPGLHRNELSRRINIPYTTLKYHLNHLVKRGVLVEKNDGKYIRYYIKHKIGEIDKNILNLLRREPVRKIVMYLDAIPDSSLIEIATYWKKNPRTIAYYIKKLKKNGLIESIPKGREINYRLAEWGEIYDLLIEYNNVFFDEELSNYIKWRDSHTFGKIGTIDDFFEAIYEIFPHPYHV
jgi:predicted transcriptional regulator